MYIFACKINAMTDDKKQNIFQRIFKVIPPLTIVGIILGLIGGYIYHLEVGCNGGT